MGSNEPAAEAGRSNGSLLLVWPLLGAPIAAVVIAEFLYTAAGIKSWLLIACTFALTGAVTWVESWRSGISKRGATIYALATVAVVGGLFAVYAYKVTGNLN